MNNLSEHYLNLQNIFSDFFSLVSTVWSQDDINYVKDIVDYCEYEDAYLNLIAISKNYKQSQQEILLIEKINQLLY